MSNSYIISSSRVVEVVKDYVFLLLEDYNIETREFFVHDLKCTQINLKRKDGWVPISQELMKKRWGVNKVNWKSLVADGLIEVKVLSKFDLNGIEITKTYSKGQNLSREFRVRAEVLEDISKLEAKTVAEIEGCTFYNLMTGSKMNKVTTHKLTNSTGHPIPKLIKDSITCIKACVIDYKAIEDYLAAFEKSIEDKSYDNPEYRRYKNDYYSYLNILNRPHKKLDNRFLEYYPSYEAQMSGRISEQGGGMQSCTRVMKQIGFEEVPLIKNYDLQSSQVWSLIQFFELASLDITWLKAYLVTDKKVYADMVGISNDCWKSCILTMIMGGSLLSEKQLKNEKFDDLDLSILNYIKEEMITEPATVGVYLKFLEVVAPLKKEIDKWHSWLVNHYILSYMHCSNGKEFVRNKTGISFPLWEYREIKKGKKVWKNLNELKRKLAAFYLQGNEATFIHYLTTLAADYGYEVTGNAHDGLITHGEIPKDAIAKAKELSGLRYAILVEKPFN